MKTMPGKIIVVGAGIFGVTAARELRRRRWEVILVDPGPIPHPRAASNDISKVVRLAYGTDEVYTALMEEAVEIWREWNARWPDPLFHENSLNGSSLGDSGRPSFFAAALLATSSGAPDSNCD